MEKTILAVSVETAYEDGSRTIHERSEFTMPKRKAFHIVDFITAEIDLLRSLIIRK